MSGPCIVAAHVAQEPIMTIRRLERSEWRGFCIYASRGFIGKHAKIEVASLQIGSQLEVHRLPLIGISYDPKSDVLELLIGELDHLIHAPREFYVDEGVFGTISFEIVDGEGVRQIVTLCDPLMLPAPTASRE
jgi:hypothetical protein